MNKILMYLPCRGVLLNQGFGFGASRRFKVKDFDGFTRRDFTVPEPCFPTFRPVFGRPLSHLEGGES